MKKLSKILGQGYRRTTAMAKKIGRTSKLREELAAASTEKQVEAAYHTAIRSSRKDVAIHTKHKTDGLATWQAEDTTVKLLIETKYDVSLKDKAVLSPIISQAVFYVKSLQTTAPIDAPNVVLIGDRNECTVLSVATLQNFLEMDIPWDMAASKGNAKLTQAILDGVKVLPWVYDVIHKEFLFDDVITRVEDLARNAGATTRATLTSIHALFVFWRDRVLSDKLTPVDAVSVFLRALFDTDSVYLHPKKKNALVVDDRLVKCDSEQYLAFFSHFQQGYSPSEVEQFYATRDRLIDDEFRRRQGAFYTPTMWVNEAHKEIEAVLGPNWRDECLVWDCCCGTGNLTRDYAFRDLILSTLEETDIEVIKAQGYNPGAVLFQHDFLGNGALPAQVVEKLQAAAASGKRLVFFMNPPFGTASNAGTEGGDHKAGIAKTAVRETMHEAGLAKASQQLYSQFMFKCAHLASFYGVANYVVATYAAPTFLCSSSYKAFRAFWHGLVRYERGHLFSADAFDGVSDSWGVSFTVWRSGSAGTRSPIRVALPQAHGAYKLLYNSDDRQASVWIREPTRGLPGVDAPQMTSGLNVAQKAAQGHDNTAVDSSVCALNSEGNSLQNSSTKVSLTSACSAGNAHISIAQGESFRRACALFAARKLVANTWVNHVDEYLRPTDDTTAYKRWNDDAVVYCLLDPKNNCTAMRDVEYKEKKWRIKNNFWWLTREQSRQLFDTRHTPSIYKDLRAETQDSYLATILPSLDLSPEARNCLAALQALLVASVPAREGFAAAHPELHLLAHDAGIYQLKHLFREVLPNEWAALGEAYKVLANKLRPGVYDHGFLLR